MLYSENESRDCTTHHDATCDTPCHTCDFDALPLVARQIRDCRRCDIGLRELHGDGDGGNTVVTAVVPW